MKIKFLNTIWSDELEGAKTFGDWVSLGNCKLDVFIISSSVLMPEIQIAYVEKLASEKITGLVSFMTTDERNLLEDKTLDEILNYQSKYVIEKRIIISVQVLKWR